MYMFTQYNILRFVTIYSNNIWHIKQKSVIYQFGRIFFFRWNDHWCFVLKTCKKYDYFHSEKQTKTNTKEWQKCPVLNNIFLSFFILYDNFKKGSTINFFLARLWFPIEIKIWIFFLFLFCHCYLEKELFFYIHDIWRHSKYFKLDFSNIHL